MASTTKILGEQQKEFDELNNKIKEFCKKNDYSYLLSMGKYYEEVDQTLIMGDYHTHDSVGLHALARKLVEGELGHAIIIAILESGKEYCDAMQVPKSSKN